VEFAGHRHLVKGKEVVLIRIASARKVETSTKDAEGMTEKSASMALKRKERVVEIRASTSSTEGSGWEEEANLDLTELRWTEAIAAHEALLAPPGAAGIDRYDPEGILELVNGMMEGGGTD
jgi:hypothetical protein